MLTIKHCYCGSQSVFEAEKVDFQAHDSRLSPEANNENPKLESMAQVVAFRAGIGGMELFTQGTVYVMNDKGRTIATYNLDLENAVSGLAPIK